MNEDPEAAVPLTKEEHIKEQKKRILKQNNQLEVVHGIITNIKYNEQNIGKEADTQNQLLDVLHNDVDGATANMILLDSKLKTLIANSSTCCLWLVIIMEILIVFLLLFF